VAAIATISIASAPDFCRSFIAAESSLRKPHSRAQVMQLLKVGDLALKRHENQFSIPLFCLFFVHWTSRRLDRLVSMPRFYTNIEFIATDCDEIRQLNLTVI